MLAHLQAGAASAPWHLIDAIESRLTVLWYWQSTALREPNIVAELLKLNQMTHHPVRHIHDKYADRA
jgi:hypothetical protein